MKQFFASTKLLSVALIVLFFVKANGQITPMGLSTGNKAPNFSAMDQSGKKITLFEELKKGAVVIVFYRGQWCPYCNKQLKQLEDSISMITDKGATVLAITPEKPENIVKTIHKTNATYPILFDDGLKIMKQYDVSFVVDTATILKYEKYGIDFKMANGKNGANLPVPTVYIINREGQIVYRHFDPDYTKRTTVKEILANL